MTWRGARYVVLSIFVGWSLFSSVRLEALPRYSARYEQGCDLCHLDPTGGGMRTPYAEKDLVPREFVMPAHKASKPLGVPTQLAPGVSFGVDLRELYAASHPATSGLDFFFMESNVYVAFQPDPKTLFYVNQGMSGTLEVFGLRYLLPGNGYLKAGRFTPAYGWKFDDHTHFVRSELGFTPPAMSDVGVEAGFSPQGGDFRIGLLNGNRGSIMGADQRLAESATGNLRFRVGPVAASIGASGYHEAGLAADVTMAGSQDYLTLGNLEWVGEADLVRDDPVVGPSVKRLAMTHEVSYMPVQGVEVIGSYDFFDPDVDLKSGYKDRWGVDLQFIPYSSVVLDGSYRDSRYVQGAEMNGVNTRDVILQVHLFY